MPEVSHTKPGGYKKVQSVGQEIFETTEVRDMDLFLPLALLFAWNSAAFCRPTENGTNKITNPLTTTAQWKRPEMTLTIAPPTSGREPEKSILPMDKTTTKSLVDLIPVSSKAAPTQTAKDLHLTSEDNSSFLFLTPDARKLTILVIAQTVVLLVLMVVLVVLCICCRSMKRKIQILKKNAIEDGETTRDEAKVQHNTTPPDSAPVHHVQSTPQQHLEYAEPYAHQKSMALHIKNLLNEGSSTANENPLNSNHVTNQIANNGLPVSPLVDDDDYVSPRVLESIVESIQTHGESKPAEPTSDKEEYKVPRNATKRAGLFSFESTSFDSSTLQKDSMNYVVMTNQAGFEEDRECDHSIQTSSGHAEEKKHVYDVPKITKRLADTFSRRTINTKIKLFQEKLKSDKTQHDARATRKPHA